ncbi:Stigma-specific protein [Trema orientale]|uniref:Stigma-specific protein n=1 Tax=Trema orientale TaxID=63057 RepID=A0A2P5F0F3_TREOI|nr:Stigma-specific protein [Trema orientale]
MGIVVIALSATPSSTTDDHNPTDDHLPLPTKRKEMPAFVGRFLAQRAQSCDKSPRVCRAKASPGPNCCNKRCVNVMNDKGNCGKCGNKCKYTEICCRGKCVNPSKDERHCGRCNNYCGRGNSCSYGLCSYA